MADDKKRPAKKRSFTPGMDLLHDDRDIIVVSKESGLLTVADNHSTRTVYEVLTRYVKKGQAKSRNRIFIVHRLDRETSGILVLAKTEDAKRKLQTDWDTTEKVYLAIVDGTPPHDEGKIVNYLTENSALKVFSSKDPSQGKRAETRYKVLKPIGKTRSLVELKILTGRKHQIRVHMADLGCPIVGDTKYGKRIIGNKSIALHAHRLTFKHPFKGTEMTFEAPAPGTFYGLGGLGLE